MDPEIISQVIGVLALAVATAFGLLIKSLAGMVVTYLEAKIGKDNFEWLKATVLLLRNLTEPVKRKWFSHKLMRGLSIKKYLLTRCFSTS